MSISAYSQSLVLSLTPCALLNIEVFLVGEGRGNSYRDVMAKDKS